MTREQVLTDRLHRLWHPAPNSCLGETRCPELRRARSVVAVVSPIVATWLVADVEHFHARLAREWGLPS